MDLEKHSLVELKQIAEEKGVENISKLKRKADLINAIEELDSAKENVSEGGTDNLIENENVKEAKNKNQTEYTLTKNITTIKSYSINNNIILETLTLEGIKTIENKAIYGDDYGIKTIYIENGQRLNRNNYTLNHNLTINNLS